MIVQRWWWKTTPPWSLLHCSPITGLNRPAAINTFYKASPFFWVTLISSRYRLPQARRAGATLLLCCGIWFMSSAWSFAVATQTALLLYAFLALVHPLILYHKIAQIVAPLIFGIHSFGDTLSVLPRVHTASQQAHEKLNIDSVRFYTHPHNFLHPATRSPIFVDSGIKCQCCRCRALPPPWPNQQKTIKTSNKIRGFGGCAAVDSTQKKALSGK